MISTLFANGKNMMYFGIVCIVCGITVFLCFDWLKHSDYLIMYWMTHNLGRYGFAGFFGGAGIIFVIRGLIQINSDKRKEQNNQLQSNW